MNHVAQSVDAKHGRQRRSQNRAFTVMELLVVVSIIVVLLLLAVPAFQSMVSSSEESLAENQLRSSLRAARDASLRTSGDGDSAAVFFFEPGGRIGIVSYVKVGELSDLQDGLPVNREIFAPVVGSTPIFLPKGWSVRAYAPARSVRDSWYGDGAVTVGGNPADPNWLFPETGFYNLGRVDDGPRRSTFMVRFKGTTGRLEAAPTTPVLLIAPRPSSVGRGLPPYDRFRADQAPDLSKFVRQILTAPTQATPSGSGLTIVEKRQLLGRESSDMVMARPVVALALYRESQLAASIGVRVDRFTQTLYAGPEFASGSDDFTSYAPRYVITPTGAAANVNETNIAGWIQGDTNLDGNVAINTTNPSLTDQPEAKLFSIDRYTGVLQLMEVTP